MVLPDKSVASEGDFIIPLNWIRLKRSTESVCAPAGIFTVKVGKVILEGRVPVVKLTLAPLVICPVVYVWANMTYEVAGYIPAISTFMLRGGWQLSQPVLVNVELPDC